MNHKVFQSCRLIFIFFETSLHRESKGEHLFMETISGINILVGYPVYEFEIN